MTPSQNRIDRKIAKDRRPVQSNVKHTFCTITKSLVCYCTEGSRK